MPIATINPATGETLRTFEGLTEAELDDKIEHAARTFRTYCRTTLSERAAWQALKVGDPLDPPPGVGPLATKTTLTDLDDQVRRSIAAGARVLVGGHRSSGRGTTMHPRCSQKSNPARRLT